MRRERDSRRWLEQQWNFFFSRYGAACFGMMERREAGLDFTLLVEQARECGAG